MKTFALSLFASAVSAVKITQCTDCGYYDPLVAAA